jgi:hypothetical protein
MDDLLMTVETFRDIARLMEASTPEQRLFALVVFLALSCTALSVIAFHLWLRLQRLERMMREGFAGAKGEIDELSDKVDAATEAFDDHAHEFDLGTATDEVLDDLPPLPGPPGIPQEATVTSIEAAHIIRQTSTRPPGAPPRRCLRPPAKRLERPGLRPRSEQGPFGGSDET